MTSHRLLQAWRREDAILLAAIIAGTAYLPATWLFADGPALTVLKGMGVGLLAFWAAARARSVDGWLIALVLAFGALGDVVLNAAGLTSGALAFLAGHLVAIGFYLRNRRTLSWAADAPIAIGRLILIPVIAFILPADRAAAPGIALYATGLGGMAAAAWLSRFPRNLVSFGALLFAVSDLLIFARLGIMAGSIVPDLLVWPLYFVGQAMIAWGVVNSINTAKPA